MDRFRSVEQSHTLHINTLSRDMEREGKRVYKFGFGQSPFFPPPEVMDALGAAVNRKEYSSVQGDPELRKRISLFHHEHNGLEVGANNILLAPGSKILLFSVLMSLRKADVFIPAPSWVSYAPQAHLARHHLIKVETTYKGRWRLSAEALNKAARQKKTDTSLLILNYPGNPDGLRYGEMELRDLSEAARELDLLVVSDEIYGLLDHAQSHVSFANFYPEKTITTTGLSKWCGAGGWRFGAAFLYEGIDQKFKETLIGIGSETYSCAPMPVQIAASKAYGDYQDIRPYITWQVDILSQIGNYCTNKLNEAGIMVHPPEGGFYLFPDFSHYAERMTKHGIMTSGDLCNQLLRDSGVALLPGESFGFKPDQLLARLAYVDFSAPRYLEPFDLQTHASKLIEGVHAIVDWIARF